MQHNCIWSSLGHRFSHMGDVYNCLMGIVNGLCVCMKLSLGRASDFTAASDVFQAGPLLFAVHSCC